MAVVEALCRIPVTKSKRTTQSHRIAKMGELSDLGQQLYAVSALARESLLPNAEAKILKGVLACHVITRCSVERETAVGTASARPGTARHLSMLEFVYMPF